MDDVFFKKLKEREGFLEQVGMDEKKDVPLSGYTKEQLKFLDEDYVKSLKLRSPKGTEAAPGLPAPADPNLQPNLQPALPTNLPTIPVAPREVPPEDTLEEQLLEPKKREEVVIPVAPTVPEISVPSEPSPVEAPIDSAPSIEPISPSTPDVSPSSPRSPDGSDLPPLDELLEDEGTEGAIDTDSEVL
jgi:hypothetical protein